MGETVKAVVVPAGMVTPDEAALIAFTWNRGRAPQVPDPGLYGLHAAPQSNRKLIRCQLRLSSFLAGLTPVNAAIRRLSDHRLGLAADADADEELPI